MEASRVGGRELSCRSRLCGGDQGGGGGEVPPPPGSAYTLHPVPQTFSLPASAGAAFNPGRYTVPWIIACCVIIIIKRRSGINPIPPTVIDRD